jgi:hypothetical protein
MSKTKLALLVFGLAFGVNILAFLISKKTFTVDEVKTVWIYELPLTASPLDAYVALDLGPHQGVVGTFFRPNHMMGEHPLETLIADTWKWDQSAGVIELNLKNGLKYSNGDPIQPSDFVSSHDFVVSRLPEFKEGVWAAFKASRFESNGTGIRIIIPKEFLGFDLEAFMSEVLTHPLSGVIHPKNLEALKSGVALTRDWISSGPYKIRKWNPKEIEIVSRDDFPVMLPKTFFRSLKYQSAPVKNPSCDFLLGRESDHKTLSEHSVADMGIQLSVFWVCRSFKQDAFCKDPEHRKVLAGLLANDSPVSTGVLSGQKVRFRIPTGSDDFRNVIREKIRSRLEAAGAQVEETSFFFKNSDQTDLELQFVVTPREESFRNAAMSLALGATRLGVGAIKQTDLLGEIARFPLQIYMKRMKGETYRKVFLDPDLEEKNLPL